MIRIVSIAAVSTLLLLGVASLCGVASAGMAVAGLGWTAAVSTVAWIYEVAMEIFMAHYSGVFVNGVKIGSRKFLRLVVPLAMHAGAILTCLPAIRQDSRWLVGACLVSLAGIIWQQRILKALI